MRITLGEAHPELIPEWSEKNYPLTPEMISYGSNKKVWWRGSCGHEWDASPKARSSGEGCPACSGKRVLQGVNDFATLGGDLLTQWDDESNDILPSEVTAGSAKVVWWKDRYGHRWQASVKNRFNGSGCPYCSNHKVLKGFNDLATMRPDLAKEWSNKNGSLKPCQFTVFSNTKVWWKCSEGHEWFVRIADRGKGSKCPYCNHDYFLSGFNDMATIAPELVLDWSERNEDMKPEEVSSKSRECVWWQCHVCGYEWRAVINSRVKGLSCPQCDRIARAKIQMQQSLNKMEIKEFLKAYPQNLMEQTLEEKGIIWQKNSTAQIGMTLEYYFPEYNAAIEFERDYDFTEIGKKRLLVKEKLCKKSNLLLIRIVPEFGSDMISKMSGKIMDALLLCGCGLLK